jgi:hypothetical protein
MKSNIPILPNMIVLNDSTVIYKGKKLKPICLTISLIRDSKKVKEWNFIMQIELFFGTFVIK